jgi:hypothetical protein
MAAKKKPDIAWGDDVAKIAAAVIRKMQKGDIKAASRVGGKIVGQMNSQGKGASAKKLSSSMKRGLESAAEQKSAVRKAASKESDARIIRKGQKVVNIKQADEGVKSKGTIYRGGREIPISRRDAANLSSRSGAAGSQSAKGNASQIEKGKKLKSAIENAPNATSRLKAQRAYREWQNKTGRRP